MQNQVYIGISQENILCIIDVYHEEGIFIISTIDKARIVPFGMGEFKINGQEFIIEPQKAHLLILQNSKKIIGEFIDKRTLKFSGMTAYYHADLLRQPYVLDINAFDNPMPERYGSDVIDSIRGFDIYAHDFTGYNVKEALEIAGINAESLRYGQGDYFVVPEVKVKPKKDMTKLYDPVTKKRIPGLNYDEDHNLVWTWQTVKKLYAYNDPSLPARIDDWSIISYNYVVDQLKEIIKAAAANIEIEERNNGDFDPEVDYTIFHSHEELIKYARLEEDDPLIDFIKENYKINLLD